MNFNIKIPKNPKLAIKMLMDSGFEAGIVGGCTRDAIIGLEPHDWDICTSATPNEVQSVFEGFKQLTMGLKHGTVTVLIDGEPLEITTYRIDGEYTDGRRPENVEFTRRLEEDLSRRDYTQNAIFYNDEDGIIDPFGGISDIKNKIIRCVGDPDKRLKEDALRILRGIRFASVLDFEIELLTKKAIFENVELLKNVSQERISEEFIKTLKGKNAASILDEYKSVIAFIIPELGKTMGFDQHTPYHLYDVWTHSIKSLEYSEDINIRLAMMFHDIGKPHCRTIDENGIGHFYGHSKVSGEIASEVFKRMKLTAVQLLDKKTLEDVISLIEYHDTEILAKKKSVKKLLAKLNGDVELFNKLITVKKADISAQSPSKAQERLEKLKHVEETLIEVLEEDNCFTTKDLDLNGNDLIEAGVPKGKKIGILLNMLLNAVIEENVQNSKKDLIQLAMRILHSEDIY